MTCLAVPDFCPTVTNSATPLNVASVMCEANSEVTNDASVGAQAAACPPITDDIAFEACQDFLPSKLLQCNVIDYAMSDFDIPDAGASLGTLSALFCPAFDAQAGYDTLLTANDAQEASITVVGASCAPVIEAGIVGDAPVPFIESGASVGSLTGLITSVLDAPEAPVKVAQQIDPHFDSAFSDQSVAPKDPVFTKPPVATHFEAVTGGIGNDVGEYTRSGNDENNTDPTHENAVTMLDMTPSSEENISEDNQLLISSVSGLTKNHLVDEEDIEGFTQ
ncbi:unnamed protein product [Cuscuta europaea]|uniref:Uncharacterized protein n=1 Tax=Cuscuta europaea TaxID=41803 RepID=A0A9P1ELA3_CUSEU|nr:unnamed protein product [Cuscuta europaea]